MKIYSEVEESMTQEQEIEFLVTRYMRMPSNVRAETLRYINAVAPSSPPVLSLVPVAVRAQGGRNLIR